MADQRRRRAPTSRLRPRPVYPRSSIWAAPPYPVHDRHRALDQSARRARSCVRFWDERMRLPLEWGAPGPILSPGPKPKQKPRARPRVSSSQRPLPLGTDASPTTTSNHPAGADRWPTCRQRPESLHPSWRPGVRCRSLLREIPRGWLHVPPRDAALFVVQSEASRSIPAPRAG